MLLEFTQIIVPSIIMKISKLRKYQILHLLHSNRHTSMHDTYTGFTVWGTDSTSILVNAVARK